MTDHTESTKQTEQEVALKRAVREQGSPVLHPEEMEMRTAGPEAGRRSREKTVFVDLGRGPEEIIMIDWAEGDPEVSRTHPVHLLA